MKEIIDYLDKCGVLTNNIQFRHLADEKDYIYCMKKYYSWCNITKLPINIKSFYYFCNDLGVLKLSFDKESLHVFQLSENPFLQCAIPTLSVIIKDKNIYIWAAWGISDFIGKHDIIKDL